MNKVFDYCSNKIKFLLLPVAIIAVGLVVYLVSGGFNFDVEFVGGTKLQVDIGEKYSNDDIKALVKDATGLDATIQSAPNNNVIIKLPAAEGDTKTAEADITPAPEATQAAEGEATAAADTAPEAATAEAEEVVKDRNTENVEKVVAAVKAKYPNSKADAESAQTVSPTLGRQTQQKALLYTMFAILCILVYIIIRFDWRSGVMAVATLAVNVLVMCAIYSITRIPLNAKFIAAMLTIVGYSINNTIVIFDRIRENSKSRKRTESISAMTNRSIKETLGRTINSTITTLITIVLLYILGVSAIKDFALPIIVGIIIGAYTSIFLASTFWAAWKEADAKARAEEAAQKRTSKKNR